MIKNKKKTLRKILTSLFVLALVLFIKIDANAAGEYATLSGGGNTSMGATVKVTLNLKSNSGLGSVTGTLTYDKNVLKFSSCSGATVNGGGGSVSYSEAFNGEGSKAITFTFTTVGQGTGTVNLSECIIADFDSAAEVNCAGGKATFTVGTPQAGGDDSNTEKKGNSKLSSLTISPGELTPAFAAGTFTYNATVPEGTTQITVSATPADKTSKVKSVNGAKSIEHGENTVTVIVEANDGSRSTYKIMVYCGVPIPGTEPDTAGAETFEINVNGSAFTVLNEIPESDIPAGFKLTTAQFNGKTVRAVTNESLGLTLCYLQNKGDEKKSFFVLDQGVVFPFVKAGLSGESYIILLQPDSSLALSKAYLNASSEILGVQFECLKHDGNVDSDFLYVYAINEKGERGWYRYDTVQKTFQRYDVEGMGKYEEGLLQSKDKADKMKLWLIIAAIAAGVFFIVMIVLIVVLAKKSKENHGQKTIDNIRANEENELQKAENRTESIDTVVEKIVADATAEVFDTLDEIKNNDSNEKDEELEVTDFNTENESAGTKTDKVVEEDDDYNTVVEEDNDYNTSVVEAYDDYNTAVVEEDDDYKRVTNRHEEPVHYETEFEFIDFDD